MNTSPLAVDLTSNSPPQEQPIQFDKQDVQIGDIVMYSYSDNRQDCFIVGMVQAIEYRHAHECYRIEITGKVWDGEIREAKLGAIIFAPVNGTPKTLGGVCNAVSVLVRAEWIPAPRLSPKAIPRQVPDSALSG